MKITDQSISMKTTGTNELTTTMYDRLVHPKSIFSRVMFRQRKTQLNLPLSYVIMINQFSCWLFIEPSVAILCHDLYG